MAKLAPPGEHDASAHCRRARRALCSGSHSACILLFLSDVHAFNALMDLCIVCGAVSTQRSYARQRREQPSHLQQSMVCVKCQVSSAKCQVLSMAAAAVAQVVFVQVAPFLHLPRSPWPLNTEHCMYTTLNTTLRCATFHLARSPR